MCLAYSLYLELSPRVGKGAERTKLERKTTALDFHLWIYWSSILKGVTERGRDPRTVVKIHHNFSTSIGFSDNSGIFIHPSTDIQRAYGPCICITTIPSSCLGGLKWLLNPLFLCVHFLILSVFKWHWYITVHSIGTIRYIVSTIYYHRDMW